MNECIFVGSSNVTMAEEEDEGEPEEIVCPQGKTFVLSDTVVLIFLILMS